MALQVRQRRKRPYPITLAKANESLQRFYFFHFRQPSPPAFTLPHLPPDEKQQIKRRSAGTSTYKRHGA
ncbi:hypothetical protein HMPREF1545_02838 [Oscillibacter sp. KLE 1728]|nr:hypothetical protein HMPREF1545_02838 [Oscillibacter sp. KLE 1728]ERK62326.1 hypothetical protein HMPREF1546_02713 [Oscillibacter sp. KLE 1745]